MSKQAAKRRAKKEQAANHAALSTLEAVTSTMAVASTSAAAAAAISTAEPDTATARADAADAAASSSGSSSSSSAVNAAAAFDPRIALKEKGNKAFADKDMAGAISFFTAAIAHPAPSDADAAAAAAAASSAGAAAAAASPPFLASVYSNRSAAYAAVYEWQRALADANKCVELAPTWGKGFFRQGAAYEGLMKLPAAAAAYSAGLAVDPRDAVLSRQFAHVQSMLREMNTVTQEQAPANPEEDKFETMINWLIAGKSRFPALYLKYYSDEYRGVHALQDVAAEDIVLEVPLSHIMTSEVAKASTIGQQLLHSGADLNSTHSYLACYLLQERRNPESFWKPYIDILPQHYHNMPIFFKQEELAYLKGSFSLGKIADRHAELKEEYDNIVRAVPSFSTYSLEEFIWARSVVITRIFGLLIGGKKTDGLVPMADMLNHKRPRETSWAYDDARGAFTITALQALSQGHQIYDSYGRKCNSRFFVNYGFSLEHNLDNQACLWFTLPVSDPHFAMKQRMMASSKVHLTAGQPKRFQIPIDYAEDVTLECFSFLRFVHAKDKEMLTLSSSDKFDLKKIEPISVRNEREVLQDLSLAAQTSLSQFDGGLDVDEQLLAQPNLSSNVRNAVLMRRGEKQVLTYYAQLAANVLPLLEMPRKQIKQFAAKRSGQQKGTYDAYIDAVLLPLIRQEAQ